MATYAELRDLISGTTADGGLRGKVVIAATIKAQDILTELTPTADRKQWAKDALAKPDSVVTDELFHYVIAANSAATIVQITGASDTAIQTNVDTAVDALHP